MKEYLLLEVERHEEMIRVQSKQVEEAAAGVRKKLDLGRRLNSLGELQGIASQLDCHIAAYCAVKDMLDKLEAR